MVSERFFGYPSRQVRERRGARYKEKATRFPGKWKRRIRQAFKGTPHSPVYLPIESVESLGAPVRVMACTIGFASTASGLCA